jgi:hypothetical protein
MSSSLLAALEQLIEHHKNDRLLTDLWFLYQSTTGQPDVTCMALAIEKLCWRRVGELQRGYLPVPQPEAK